MTDVIRNVTNNSQLTGSGVKSANKPGNHDGAADTKKTSATDNALDQVDITNAAQRVDELIASLDSEPVVDRQKVEAIKSALQEGRYQINSAMIADRLIEIDELLQ